MNDLLKKIIESPGNNKNLILIEKAFKFAEKAHSGQKRLSNEDYITHPAHVAYFLANLGLDSSTIAAALLHDVLEDTGVTSEKLNKEFGKDITFMVEGVTKLKKIDKIVNPVLLQKNGSEKGADARRINFESLKKMFFATAEDIRVMLIKLADKYHNMETLRFMPKTDQKRIALETLEVYAPVAGRLGMGKLKGQLEDMAFPYVYPKEYLWLSKTFKDRYADRLNYIERARPIIKRYLKEAGILVVDLHSRAKHYYSLYQKLQRKEMDLDKIHDLVAMRVIVPDIKSCYETLGIIHKHYKPLPGLIKDYIALPKPNGYQSLHTTIFCEKGRVVEIQIRTEHMHDYAENGIAAHWTYSESRTSRSVAEGSGGVRPNAMTTARGKIKSVPVNIKEIEWVSELKKFLEESRTGEALVNLKIDFFKNHIFAFTPRGDVKDLPEGATPIDFAYAVHTNLGHATKGAKVNDKIVPLNYELKNGDVVEIIKGKEKKPSFDWLKIARTALAKKSINSWFREMGDVRVAKTEEARDPSSLKLQMASKRQIKLTTNKIGEPLIAGQTGLLYKIAKCCNPTPDQKIKGYMTLNQGVSIHAVSCANLKKVNGNGKRIVTASWAR